MTTPANLSFGDILTRCMNSLRLRVDNGVESVKVQAVINEVYRDVCAKQDWWWRIKKFPTTVDRKIMVGFPAMGQGTAPASVSLTYGSTAVTFSDATLNGVDLTGWTLSIPENALDPSALYTVASWAVPPAGVLSTVYTGATGSSTGYRLYHDTFNLPTDVGKVTRVQGFGFPHQLDRIGIEEMERRKQYDRSEGMPSAWSVYDFQTTGDPTQVRQLRVFPFPDKLYRLDVWYQQNLNTEMLSGTQPLIPDDYRQILIYGTLARGYPIFLNDTERGQYYQSLFNDVLALMSAQQREYASDRTGVQPEMRMYRGQSNRRRTSYTLGSWFDRLPYSAP